MSRFSKINIGIGVAAILGFLLGCSNPRDEHADSQRGHAHPAPHGGALVMLGQHAAQLELVPENDGKFWALYVLDGGAERFVRVEQEAVTAKLDGRAVVFQALENAATGEAIGNTSKFGAQADWLDPEGRFQVEIDEIVFSVTRFQGLSSPFRKGSIEFQMILARVMRSIRSFSL